MYRFDSPLSKIGISPELSIHFMNGIHQIEGHYSLYNMKKKMFYPNLNFRKISGFLTFFHKNSLNLNISIVPVCASMNFLPVVDNIQMEGTIPRIFYVGPSFYFMIKIRKLFVIVFFTFTLYFIQ